MGEGAARILGNEEVKSRVEMEQPGSTPGVGEKRTKRLRDA